MLTATIWFIGIVLMITGGCIGLATELLKKED